MIFIEIIKEFESVNDLVQVANIQAPSSIIIGTKNNLSINEGFKR